MKTCIWGPSFGRLSVHGPPCPCRSMIGTGSTILDAARAALGWSLPVTPRSYGRGVLEAVLPLACPACGGRTGGRRAPVCDECAAYLRPAPAATPPRGVDS